MNLQGKTLVEISELMAKNLTSLKEAQVEFNKWASAVEPLTLQLRKIKEEGDARTRNEMEPVNDKLRVLQEKLQEKNMDIMKMSIHQHELEGALVVLGGTIEEDKKMILPDTKSSVVDDATFNAEIDSILLEAENARKEREAKSKIITDNIPSVIDNPTKQPKLQLVK